MFLIKVIINCYCGVSVWMRVLQTKQTKNTYFCIIIAYLKYQLTSYNSHRITEVVYSASECFGLSRRAVCVNEVFDWSIGR